MRGSEHTYRSLNPQGSGDGGVPDHGYYTVQGQQGQELGALCLQEFSSVLICSGHFHWAELAAGTAIGCVQLHVSCCASVCSGLGWGFICGYYLALSIAGNGPLVDCVKR